MNYKEYTLSELATIKYGKNQKKVVSDSGSIPIYGTGGLMGYAKEALYSKPSVLIGRKGTIEKVRYVTRPFWTVDTLFYTIINEKIIRPRYLYYLFLTIDLKKYNEGTTIPSLRTETLNRIKFFVPSLNVQDRALSILGALDDKIELNQKINENLKQQAQAVYTLMFIVNANTEWQQGHLSDLITVRYGKDHKKLADGIYPVYGSGGFMRRVKRPLYDKESVLIPRKGTLNNVMYINEPFWSVDTMFYTEMLFPNIAKFVYHFVKGKDLASMNTGSAVPSMTIDILNSMELTIPSNKTLETFENIVSPMYTMMQYHEKELAKLAEVRNTLLPHLMSGELDVSNLDM